MLKVHEIFRSIQGEGIDIGMPMIFIRFSGCNQNCSWCDTKYADKKSEKLTYLEVLKKVDYFKDTVGVTLTGGEPFIQDINELDWLIYELKGKGYYINIETNGVIFPKLKHHKFIDSFSISPKLSSSGNKNSLNLKTLSKYLEKYSHKISLKFVVSNQTDLTEMFITLNYLENIKEKRVPIIIQPNIDDKTVKSVAKQNKKFLALFDLVFNNNHKEAKEYNIRIIPQFHKYLWADKKGV